MTYEQSGAVGSAPTSRTLAGVLPWCPLATAAVVLIVVTISFALKLLVVTSLWCVSGLVAVKLKTADGPSFRSYAEILFWAQVLAVCMILLQIDRTWLPLFAVGTVVLAVEAWRRSGMGRLIALSAAVGVFGLLLSELAVLARDLARLVGAVPKQEVILLTDKKTGRRLPDGKSDSSFWVLDPVRGYFGRPNTLISVTALSGGKMVYRARYSLDETGARITPAVRPESRFIVPRTVVFLGDSMAFGMGVDDGDNAPAFLGRLSGGAIRCVNLGFMGFGPHQALASLEEGLERREVDGRADGVLFTAFGPQRVVGLAPWDTHGPRYTLSPDGEPLYTGPFDAHPETRIVGLLNKSVLFRRIVTPRLQWKGQEELFVRLVKRCSEVFCARHGGRFLVFIWGGKDDPSYVSTMRRLLELGVEVVSLAEVFPKSGGVPGNEMTIPDDGHPSDRGHEAVASALWARLRQEASDHRRM